MSHYGRRITFPEHSSLDRPEWAADPGQTRFVQQQLIKHGHSVGPTGADDNYGAHTDQAWRSITPDLQQEILANMNAHFGRHAASPIAAMPSPSTTAAPAATLQNLRAAAAASPITNQEQMAAWARIQHVEATLTHGTHFDKDGAPKVATAFGGDCSLKVVNALWAAGIHVERGDARDMPGHLVRAGFSPLQGAAQLKFGDVATTAPVAGYPFGHIAFYNGHQWVSDAAQHSVNVFTQHDPVTLWRNPTLSQTADAGMANRAPVEVAMAEGDATVGHQRQHHAHHGRGARQLAFGTPGHHGA